MHWLVLYFNKSQRNILPKQISMSVRQLQTVVTRMQIVPILMVATHVPVYLDTLEMG